MTKKVESKKTSSLKELGIYLTKEIVSSPKIQVIPTGSLSLNNALKIGGWPEGKIIELFGVDSSGKTTLALHSVSEAQKMGKAVVYMDLENTLNLEWAKKIGVDVDNLYVAKPENGEKAFELINKVLEIPEIGLIVVDSVAALVPSYEFESNFEDHTMGLHARLMSKGLRIMQSIMIGKKTTVIFINQVREKIGNSFIPMTTTTGGRALKYAASVRVEIKKCEAIKSSDDSIIGFEVKCVIVKNKYGSPLVIARSGIYFDSGFDNNHEIIHELILNKLLIKKGSWLEYEGTNISQGLVRLREKMMADEGLFSALKNRVFPD